MTVVGEASVVILAPARVYNILLLAWLNTLGCGHLQEIAVTRLSKVQHSLLFLLQKS